jgi:hypothetical protein
MKLVAFDCVQPSGDGYGPVVWINPEHVVSVREIPSGVGIFVDDDTPWVVGGSLAEVVGKLADSLVVLPEKPEQEKG